MVTHAQPDDDLSVAKTHNGLISAFGLRVVKVGLVDVSLGRNLNRGQTLRQVADYTGDPLTLSDVEQLMRDANDFFSTIKKLVGHI